MSVQEMTYPSGTRVLVWRLDEDAPRLLDLCREQGIQVDDIADLPVKRLREKAAERLLLCQAFGRPVTLLHDGQGAPSVEGMDVNISITHTMRLVALAVNKQQIIGLDAEQVDRHQVIKVRGKYLNSNEQRFIADDNLASHIIAWTAKEAIIKAERNSAIDWTDGICLEPFVPGTGETRLWARYGNHRYRLTAIVHQDHYITVAEPTERLTQ